jgi:hypothetical protein
MDLLNRIGILQIQLGSMIDDFYFEDTGEFRHLLSCLDRQMEILQNNYSKTRAYPLNMLENASDNRHHLNRTYIAIVSLLFTLSNLSNGYCKLSLLKATSAMACRSVHRYVDDHISALLQERILDLVLDSDCPNDPLICLSERFKMRLCKELVFHQPPESISISSFNYINLGLARMSNNLYIANRSYNETQNSPQ